MLFSLKHFAVYYKLLFIFLTISDTSVPAIIDTLQWRTQDTMSFTYKLNKMGPATTPWGIPYLIKTVVPNLYYFIIVTTIGVNTYFGNRIETGWIMNTVIRKQNNLPKEIFKRYVIFAICWNFWEAITSI